MKRLKTMLQKWKAVQVKGDVQILRWYFKNTIRFQNCRVQKVRCGVNVHTVLKKYYVELSYCKNFIHMYNDDSGVCVKEIVLQDFEDNLKRNAELFGV